MENNIEKPFLIPSHLKKGDLVLLISPASYCEKQSIGAAKKFLEEEWSLQVAHLPYRQKFGQFSGTDQERLQELQWALDHPTAKAIICMRGGYGSNRIIDQVTWDKFIISPKWIIGFSDITHILIACLQQQIACIHGPMGIHLPRMNNTLKQHFYQLLFDGTSHITIKNNHHTEEKNIRTKIFGGNLTIFQNTIGTKNQYILNDSFLFLEEINEYPYVLDRLFQHIKRAGILTPIQGLLLGDMTIKEHPKALGISLNELFSIPDEKVIISNFPAGHIEENHPIVFGVNYLFNIEKEYISIMY